MRVTIPLIALLALAVRAPAAQTPAASLQQAQDNFQSLAEMHFGGPAEAGGIPLRLPSGKEVRLSLDTVELETVHPVAPGRFAALGAVRDSRGRKINVRIVADLTGSNWHIAGVKLVNAEGARNLRAEAAGDLGLP